MDKRINRKNVILYIIFTSLLIVLTILNIFTYNNYKKNLDTKIVNYNNEFDDLNKELEILKEKEIFINNIDNNLDNIKQEYYNTLKIFEDKVSNKEINYKIAYLTFDDGPYYNTHNVLKILKDNNIRATFFTSNVNNDNCYDNPGNYCGDLYYEEAKDGHTIANHTYSHAILKGLYNSTDSFIYSVKLQEQLIKERTGITTNIVRFPGGSASSKNLKYSIIESLRQNGYGWVDWTAQDGDGGYVPNTTVAYNNFVNTINEDIEVVLLHDYSPITTQILPDIINYLKENNYIMLPLFYDSKMVNK